MTIKLFEAIGRLGDICERGYVQSHRRGSTGVGNTLENLLGIEENNLASPDLHRIELKATRENSNSPITLFTYDRNAWQMSQKSAVTTYGIKEDSGRINLYFTVTNNESDRGFRLRVTPETVDVVYKHETCLASWSLDSLADKFNDKIRNILLITAKVKKENSKEYFWYYRGSLLTGYMTSYSLSDIFIGNFLRIDLRLHLKPDGTVRNHGTAFRILEKDWSRLFRQNDVFDLQHIEEFPFDEYRGFFD